MKRVFFFWRAKKISRFNYRSGVRFRRHYARLVAGFVMIFAIGVFGVGQNRILALFNNQPPAPVVRESVETSALESQLKKDKNLASLNKLEKQDAGLESAVKGVLNTYPSSQKWSVFVQDLSSTRSLSINTDKSYDIGGLYKLFLPFPLEDKVPSDNWSSWYISNSNLSYCVGAMFKETSDDNCAKSIGNMIKWEFASHYVQDHGYGHTKIDDINSTSTPRDIGSLLINLKRNKILSDSARRTIFDSLYIPKSKNTNSGIAKACKDCRVANMVASVNGSIHDAGVVTRGNHSYVVVIMSKNGTSKQITQIAKAIDAELAR